MKACFLNEFQGGRGQDVMIFKIFSPKNLAKILAFFLLKRLLIFAKM
jgi:hypothetical protein